MDSRMMMADWLVVMVFGIGEFPGCHKQSVTEATNVTGYKPPGFHLEN